MPSPHVCWASILAGSPQFRNQAPPRAQQLNFPASLRAHLGHAILVVGTIEVVTIEVVVVVVVVVVVEGIGTPVVAGLVASAIQRREAAMTKR